jgi:sensor c-di-GMP phosphodiesterase-like protein
MQSDWLISVCMRPKKKAGTKWFISMRSRTRRSKESLSWNINYNKPFKKGEIFVQYQPLVNLNTNQLYGIETLVRWNHPELGILLPDTFIPIAEETGLIIPLGQKIFQLAFHDFADWIIQCPTSQRALFEH